MTSKRGKVELNAISRSVSGVFQQAKFDWIKTLHGSTWQTLFDGAKLTPAVIPVGASWELHFQVSTLNTEGRYMVGVSFKAGEGRGFIDENKLIGGSVWKWHQAFNMGDMSEAGILIDHIKLWVSDVHQTEGPPEADW